MNFQNFPFFVFIIYKYDTTSHYDIIPHARAFVNLFFKNTLLYKMVLCSQFEKRATKMGIEPI